jgi:DNA-binding PadR family transcriptional regulator
VQAPRLEDLHAQGLIRREKVKRTVRQRGGAPRTYWEEWLFDVTDAGLQKTEREQRAAAEADRDAPKGASGAFDWETEALPVLQAVYAASGSADPDLGMSETTINEVLGREPDDARTARVLTMLIRGDYLDTTIETMGSRNVQITEKGLQVTAGWLSGAPDAAYTRLLALIDKHVEEAASDEERSKWQRLRDAVVGVGRDVAVEVLSAAAQTGLRHIP